MSLIKQTSQITRLSLLLVTVVGLCTFTIGCAEPSGTETDATADADTHHDEDGNYIGHHAGHEGHDEDESAHHETDGDENSADE